MGLVHHCGLTPGLADIDRVDQPWLGQKSIRYHSGNVVIRILLQGTGIASAILPLHNYSNG